jgi:hypothetical protein
VLGGGTFWHLGWNLNVVLVFISFMASVVEDLFMCFWAICTSSFVKFLFSSFAHFFIRLLIFFGVWFFKLPVNFGY